MKRDKILYLECCSGISGDMTVGALLDLGADQEKLKEELEKLPVSGYKIRISRKKAHGLMGCDFEVILEEGSGGEEKGHCHRHYGEIKDLLEGSELSEEVKKLALRIFEIVARAEAKVHGVPLEEVAFHEVGAVDSIVDIVSAAVCIVDLGVEKTAVSELWEGKGTARCQHGRIPVPAPAVAEILKDSNLPLRFTDMEGELVTPTGAAIAAALRNSSLPKKAVILGIGIGTGKRELEHPNVLRAMLLEEQR